MSQEYILMTFISFPGNKNKCTGNKLESEEEENEV
jgi:hypothetical protein